VARARVGRRAADMALRAWAGVIDTARHNVQARLSIGGGGIALYGNSPVSAVRSIAGRYQDVNLAGALCDVCQALTLAGIS